MVAGIVQWQHGWGIHSYSAGHRNHRDAGQGLSGAQTKVVVIRTWIFSRKEVDFYRTDKIWKGGKNL